MLTAKILFHLYTLTWVYLGVALNRLNLISKLTAKSLIIIFVMQEWDSHFTANLEAWINQALENVKLNVIIL